MPYLVDSDWIIDHLANVPAATELLALLAPEGITISVITYMEAYQGTLRADDPEASRDQLEKLVDSIPVPLLRRFARRIAQAGQEAQPPGARPPDRRNSG